MYNSQKKCNFADKLRYEQKSYLHQTTTMKKVGILFFCLVFGSLVYGQIKQAGYQNPLSVLQKQGWQIHSHSLSFDEQTIVFSAKAPKQNHYDLYTARKKGKTWENVQALPINTPANELYPTLSSSEQELIYVRHSTEAGKGKRTIEKFYMMYSSRVQMQWSNPEVIIISEGNDISPIMMADGKTVIFASSRSTKEKKENNFALFYTRRIDERNWYKPILILAPEDKNEHYYAPYIKNTFHEGKKCNITIGYTRQVCDNRDTTYSIGHMMLPERFHPLPIITLEGTIRDTKTHHFIPANINIFHAISFKPLANLTNSSIGTYKIALPHGAPYLIDITGEHYSHFYSEHDCNNLQADTTITTHIELDKQLNIRINAFDDEILLPISPDRIELNGGTIKKYATYAEIQLPIGKNYDIRYEKLGYEDTTLHINTQNSILLTQSELDIEMRPSKTNINVRLVDADSLNAITGIVNIQNKDKDEDLTIHSKDSTNHIVLVRQGDSYQLHARAKGYVYKDTILHIPYTDKDLTHTIPLVALRKAMVLQLRNIHFDHNSSALTPSSYEELDKLVKLMQDNPSMLIELSAHTDDVGSDQYNIRLSQQRGEAAKRYLVRKGIEKERIDAKGYGKNKPLVPNNSDENRAINRRVEFTINEIQ